MPSSGAERQHSLTLRNCMRASGRTCRSLPARRGLVLALLACGLHVAQARPVAAQGDDGHHVPEITELQGEFGAGRVVAGSVAFAYVGAFTGAATGFLVDRGTGCGSGNCEWDGVWGLEIGALAGTVIGPVVVSHWLNERRGNSVVNFFVTGVVATGAVAALGGSGSRIVWAVPALAGLAAGLTEMGTGRPAPRADTRVVPPPPHPER